MKLKLNVALHGRAAGEIITVPDDKGIPLDQYWRRRLKDAERDGCVEIVSRQKRTKPQEVKDTTHDDHSAS